MSAFDDLPLIRCKPTPSDAVLAAERDAQYAALIATDTDGWPPLEVAG